MSLAERRTLLQRWMVSDAAMERDVFVAFKALCTVGFYEQSVVVERIEPPRPGASLP
jgi:hypothetical protein